MQTIFDEVVSTVTPAHLRGLRRSDTITLHCGSHGQSYLRAHRDVTIGLAETTTIYTRTQIRNYGGDLPDGPSFQCFHSIHSGARNDVFASVLKRIRPGDTLSLIWSRSNDNDNNRSVGWHRDEVRIGIRRNGDPERVEIYLLGIEVGPDNTARMVRR